MRKSENRIRVVLLVEDNEDSRTIYRLMFEHAGCRVLEAPDGETALRLAVEDPPDVILLDLGLPRMTGYEVAQQLKAGAATRNIPIVAVSAHVFSDHRELAARVGCDAFIAKPVEPRVLHEQVAHWLV